MKRKYIIALDQGTTSSRALLVGDQGEVIAQAQREFSQIYPRPGWVEHDPREIWSSQWSVFEEILAGNDVSPEEVAGIGITNQRETTIVWERQSGKPIYNAIVWQDKRTASVCEKMREAGWDDHVRKRTGLVIDSYFSATKLYWILEHIKDARKRAEAGELIFGTVDSWLLWEMTGGRSHLTDHTNASRTMLYDIVNLDWDDRLLEYFGIPRSMLPAVKRSASDFGVLDYKGVRIPILGVAGDQQAALVGQACHDPGETKNTYGTGCFMLMNTGSQPVLSGNGMLTTLACNFRGGPSYALEGSVLVAGAAIQWLRDGLGLIEQARETESVAREVWDDDDGIVVVPALAGLGAPYWDMYARGTIFGLSRDTDSRHLVKATLQSIAFQTRDVIRAMETDSGLKVPVLKVDGGASQNDLLMQFQADILGIPVRRPANVESTAMGAALLAGISSGLWQMDDISSKQKIDRVFQPSMSETERSSLYARWEKAVERTRKWLEK
jgi:glycerol kinase